MSFGNYASFNNGAFMQPNSIKPSVSHSTYLSYGQLNKIQQLPSNSSQLSEAFEDKSWQYTDTEPKCNFNNPMPNNPQVTYYFNHMNKLLYDLNMLYTRVEYLFNTPNLIQYRNLFKNLINLYKQLKLMEQTLPIKLQGYNIDQSIQFIMNKINKIFTTRIVNIPDRQKIDTPLNQETEFTFV